MSKDKQEILFYLELAQLRKSKDIQINEISEATKINIKYIEAIERGDFVSLPDIYVRLFIRSYAEYLEIDSHVELIHSFVYVVRFKYFSYFLSSLPHIYFLFVIFSRL